MHRRDEHTGGQLDGRDTTLNAASYEGPRKTADV